MPSLYWDDVVFTSDEVFRLEYEEGTAKIETNMGSFQLPDTVISDWALVRYDELNGQIPGCYQYSFYVTIKVRVVAD